ncbi:GNAT family N-acetyltransferase [Hymenobacter latericus]|uniref:GNAT family N-acetyltransferase n=1 Tax=Hymenobacter sp. YIM 151858-1 TaxID=2987688 RepID=UPI002225F48C|nr:GNAT family N-acetyltransferase [Hymenobacter sp. YIM 151858-1]UYZ60849.1 GNAT family N-acetyltransferase [Hymenobacter sp. YIM 151858-1]
MLLQPLTEHHWPAVQAIYAAGIATGNATFETRVPEWAAWHAGHLGHSRLVALGPGGQVLGWAALSPVSGRCVYGGVAEVSIYIAPDARGQGVGLHLLQALVQAAEANGIWTLQAGILQENAASLALHAKAGFRTIGFRERIGQLHGVWRNVVLLERRSSTVGTESSAAEPPAAVVSA